MEQREILRLSAYISKCIDDVVPRVNVRTFPSQKPWVNGDVRAKLRARSSAYSSGDLEALRKSRYDLRKTIRDAKRAYRDKLESNYPRHMWCVLRSITDYKGRNSSDAQPAVSLPDELNTFYVRFEASNTIPIARLAEEQDDCTLSLCMADMRRAFKRVNPRKSAGTQLVRMGNLSSSALTLSTGAPQGCVLSPLLYALFTHDCVATRSSNAFLKFADDTTILGLICNNDETAYRE
ncbi:hypothetical protein SKAU_G00095890 [Synaphobranchus kaupii]|uniref:Reverse transcriptase domain-containing protein n=1 Tax=Synaphobranchus kaupii TaxID=118154 RepID=A0A9Q1FYJ3_SYNKA|nr:hypothetical protein SKAU_G00095890 [Synaphobranchus kaupii]